MSRMSGVPEREASWISRFIFRGIRRRAGNVSETWKMAAHQPGLLLGWALHELGRVDLDLMDTVAARPLFERSLAVQEEAYGADSLNAAFPLTKLAHIHSLEGDRATFAVAERGAAVVGAEFEGARGRQSLFDGIGTGIPAFGEAFE